MLKELIKIQIIAVLIVVINAVATQNLTFNGKDNSIEPTKNEKVLQSKKSGQLAQTTNILSNPPRNILINVIKNSLN